ncbi:MAG: hypothetical protein M1820_001148 [Bogoriella megaspora]|nr:MAG: hypothetical protein M1820_001148 [Bogoriella megaspora]
MAEVIRAPAQYRQPSRKGKRAWRKNINLQDVEEGLDEVRDQIIQGGIISEKGAHELFVTDTEGDEAIQKEYNKTNKPLKADEILAQRSTVPAIDTRKRKSTVTDRVIQARHKKSKTGYVKPEDLARLRAIANGGEKATKNISSTDNQAAHDPWAPQYEQVDAQFSFLENHKPKPVKEPKTLKHAPLSLAANGHAFAAVQKPDAGRSYNPNFDDWEALIEREGDKEVAMEQKRRAEASAEAQRLARAQEIAAEPDQESDAGGSAWESEWEGIQSEMDDAEWVKQKRPERKTPAQRNKLKRRKEEERRLNHEAKLKEKEEQVKRIKQVAKEMSERDRNGKQVAKVEISTDESDNSDVELHRRRKFGNASIPEAPLEVVLADELEESLRKLKPEGNLLVDRYRNLVLNGKLEARRLAQHKKVKRDITEKWSYKDWKLPS